MENRKKDHIDLAFKSQTLIHEADKRFHYEPLLNAHPSEEWGSFNFLNKNMRVPVWISSMTGGTKLAGKINRNLAKACNEFGMGMGLGSCRIILDKDTYFADFDMRRIIGDDLPLYANIGINQVEKAFATNTLYKFEELIEKLKADGLIIHVNPLQEWFQPEGDRLTVPAIDLIKRLLDETDINLIIKEVGQGMGPASLLELMKLPLAAIEFAAFGGTNFAKVELLRNSQAALQLYEPLSLIGENADNMVEYLNMIIEKESGLHCRQVIISGGIRTFLDGFYLINKIKLPAIYGQASAFLRYAKESYEELHDYIEGQIKGLVMAKAFLRIRDGE
jgi:isopentenyl-diphosphate delta-isomerase